MKKSKNRKQNKSSSIFEKYFDKHLGSYFVGIVTIIGILTVKYYINQNISNDQKVISILDNSTKILTKITKDSSLVIFPYLRKNDSLQIELNKLNKKFTELNLKLDSINYNNDINLKPKIENIDKSENLSGNDKNYPNHEKGAFVIRSDEAIMFPQNPYPKYFDKIKIGDNILTVDSVYRQEILNSFSSNPYDKVIRVSLKKSLFTSIYYKSIKSDMNDYNIKCIEFFIESKYYEYFLNQCINVFSAKNAKIETDIITWNITGGIKLQVKKWTEYTYSYIILLK
jgi:hypothetical protein